MTKIPEKVVFLPQKEYIVTTKKQKIMTVLGSCVAVIMISKVSDLTGMCHAYLPRIPPLLRKSYIIPTDAFQYVDYCIETMYKSFQREDIQLSDIEIKLFGGAQTLVHGGEKMSNESIGEENVKSAIKTLQSLNLDISVSDVGGNMGRKIIFNTETGEVLLKRL